MRAGKFIALDIGVDGIKLAEFKRHASGQLELLDVGMALFANDPPSGMTEEAVGATTLKRLLDERKLSVRAAAVALDGHFVFSRLVKLPPVSPEKLAQTIRHEAVQNIPFPLDEVVWDSHLVAADAPEPEVLLVAAKTDLVAGMVHAVSAAGLSPEFIDAGPAAMGNAVRYCCPDLSGPVLVVDMRAQSSGLVFIDGPRTFFRTLPVACNMMERLVQEISRSITFYRNQQDGRVPELLLLAGELAGLDEPERHLSERLKLPVRIFDPLQHIKVAETLDVAEPHRFGVLVGLAVRRAALSAMAINLVPRALERERLFRRRQPVMVACAALAALIAGIWAAGLLHLSGLVAQESAAVGARIAALEQVENQLIPIERKIAGLGARAAVYHGLVRQRTQWLVSLAELRARLPEGMFLSELAPLREDGALVGMRITVISYLDKEPAGEDAVILLRDRLRASERFSEKTSVFKRPTKLLFARWFILDVYLEEPGA
ncbi:MAG: pilus assembly protein PilM [Kiritimatiellales bacterium]|nr:pilus assembly protein PilM [Kiritimatiellales bacterium]